MTAVREASRDDINLIQKIAHETWYPTYQEIISHQQIEYMLDLFYSKEALLANFNEGQRFFLAEESGEIAGFTAVHHIHFETRQITRIPKIYILPIYQGRGIGNSLLQKVEELAVANGSVAISLNVNRKNLAQHFYKKAGFEIVASEDINIGCGWLMEDYIMEKNV